MTGKTGDLNKMFNNHQPNGSENAGDVMIRVENLKKYFPIVQGVVWRRRVGAVKAVDGISFNINKGETLGVVGESGCGKSTAGRAILQLQRPSSGRVYIDDTELTTLNKASLRRLRPRMQMIFQDSYDSLNPRQSVGQIIAEPMVINGTYTRSRIYDRIAELLELVGLSIDHAGRFPHEFSGGQRQRINIARALALEPDFIVCDEPISALDISIQAQVVNLFQDLQRDLNLTYLFIAHDLSMVQHISNRVAVMYLGKIMELAGRDDLFANPAHPYTQSLISSAPFPDPALERKRKRITLSGEVPSPANPPAGCVFHTRCPVAEKICAVEIPAYREIMKSHFAACHLADDQGAGKIL